MFAYAARRYRFDKHLVEVWSHFEHCIPKALRMLNKRIVGLTPVVTQCGDVRVEVSSVFVAPVCVREPRR